MKTRLLLTLAGLALVAAACGSQAAADEGVASLDDLGTDVLATDADPIDVEEAMLAMAQCMRDEGVDVSDPEVDEEGNVLPPRPADPESVDRSEIQAAREACSEYLDGIEIGFRDIDQTELEDNLLDYATCMRANGYDLPDPDFAAIAGETGPGGGGPFGEIDRTDPDFAAAQEACEDILGDLGAGRRGLGGGPGGGA